MTTTAAAAATYPVIGEGLFICRTLYQQDFSLLVKNNCTGNEDIILGMLT